MAEINKPICECPHCNGKGIVEYYETSDDESFSYYDEAFEHEIWWLNQINNENTK